MRTYTLRILGITIASWRITSDEITLNINTDDDPEEDTEEEAAITGGASHNYERDTTPITPEDRYQWEYDRFGFQKDIR